MRQAHTQRCGRACCSETLGACEPICCRQCGHTRLSDCSRSRRRHAAQKVWPHGKSSVGCRSLPLISSRQMPHLHARARAMVGQAGRRPGEGPRLHCRAHAATALRSSGRAPLCEHRGPPGRRLLRPWRPHVCASRWRSSKRSTRSPTAPSCIARAFCSRISTCIRSAICDVTRSSTRWSSTLLPSPESASFAWCRSSSRSRSAIQRCCLRCSSSRSVDMPPDASIQLELACRVASWIASGPPTRRAPWFSSDESATSS